MNEIKDYLWRANQDFKFSAITYIELGTSQGNHFLLFPGLVWLGMCLFLERLF